MRILIQCLLLFSLLGLSLDADASLRCNGKLVKTGDRMFEVREHCGEPDVVVPLHSAYTVRHGHVPTREEWQYNFGPHRLMRFLRFQDGRLVQIRTGKHGFRSSPGSCSPNNLETGMTQLELAARCGEPRSKELRVTSKRYRVDGLGRVYQAGQAAEDWIYDFGSNRFVRIVTLINGQVVNIERSSSRGS
ncbi:hypothetical protein J2T60_002599 [Natronospira proteinivora]|uniref:DUF2845 domain-containing protein n=1 Tax=Natronospira proteinivora TaxID=1807133 RepID=A0ABT1GB78_9GAMM|nr:DUF2845 domain-containing protein [Natronospira proteinivora]MCP1728585.1 hypothetical protein [Natronospira proteinivora]